MGPHFSPAPQDRLHRWSGEEGTAEPHQIQTVAGLGDSQEGRVGLGASGLTRGALNLFLIL